MLAVTAPIRTARLVLRPYREGDLPALDDLQRRPDVLRYLPWERREGAALAEWLADKRTRTRLAGEGDRLVLAIGLPEGGDPDGRYVGEVVLIWRNVAWGQAEVGYVLRPDQHGRGYATEAAEAVVSLAFSELDGLHRVYARTDARNLASAAVLRRLGMRQEAHFVGHAMFKGEWAQELVFAVLDDEWRARGDRGRPGPHAAQTSATPTASTVP